MRREAGRPNELLRYASFLLLAAISSCLQAGTAAETAAVAGSAGAGSNQKIDFAVPDINKKFAESVPSVGHWIRIFSSTDREVFSARADILKAMNLKSGMTVADVGAGTGIFSLMFAEKVGPGGKVFAVEISKKFYDHLQQIKSQEHLEQFYPLLSEPASVGLSKDSIDCVFVCDTLHHFEQAAPMLRSIHDCLKAGGSLIIVDFDRIPGVSRQWILDHILKGKKQVIADLEKGGFELVEEVKIDKLKEIYFLRFKKTAY